MISKLVLEVREVMSMNLFLGDIKKNVISKPYISFLLNEIESFKQLRLEEFTQKLWDFFG